MSKPDQTKLAPVHDDRELTTKIQDEAKILKKHVDDARTFFVNKYLHSDDNKWLVTPGDQGDPVADPDLSDALGTISNGLQHFVTLPIGTELDEPTVRAWTQSVEEYRKKRANMTQKIKAKGGANYRFIDNEVQQKITAPVDLVLTDFAKMLPSYDSEQ